MVGVRNVSRDNWVVLVSIRDYLAESNVVYGFFRSAFCKVLLKLCWSAVRPTVCNSKIRHCVALSLVFVVSYAPHYNNLSSKVNPNLHIK